MSEIEDEVVARKCQHALYGDSRFKTDAPYKDDMILIKEKVFKKSGEVEIVIRLLKNYEYPFWINKPAYRKHQQKKTREFDYKLDERSSTRAGLVYNIKKALDIRTPSYSLNQVCRNPYVYGTDITPTALIKHQYQQRWPDIVSTDTMACMDTETDVIRGDGEIDLIAITMKNKAYLAVTERWLETTPIDEATGKKTSPMSPAEFLKRASEYIPERLRKYFDERKIELVIEVHPTPMHAIKGCMDRAHEWKPDFITFWNMHFDMPKIIESIEKYGGDCGDIFSDPSVPKEFRKFRYQEGPAFKMTQSNKLEPLSWYDRWHVVHCLASFYFLDQACVFRKMRFSNGKEAMGLDKILRKYAGISKLKGKHGDKLDNLATIEWHKWVSLNDKLEYAAYNLFDDISCEILEEQPKVGDITRQFSVQCRHSDYDRFPSMPKRSVDNAYFTCRSQNKVLGSTSDNLLTEFDEHTVNIRNWIVTLPAHTIITKGLRLIKELPDLPTKLYGGVYDIDIVGSYPHGQLITNGSRETTAAELIYIDGVDEMTKRYIGLNMTSGTINAMEVVVNAMSAPTFNIALATFNEDLANGNVEGAVRRIE